MCQKPHLKIIHRHTDLVVRQSPHQLCIVVCLPCNVRTHMNESSNVSSRFGMIQYSLLIIEIEVFNCKQQKQQCKWICVPINRTLSSSLQIQLLAFGRISLSLYCNDNMLPYLNKICGYSFQTNQQLKIFAHMYARLQKKMSQFTVTQVSLIVNLFARNCRPNLMHEMILQTFVLSPSIFATHFKAISNKFY